MRSAPSPKCIACGSDGVELYDGLTDYLAGTPGTWRMVRCADAECFRVLRPGGRLVLTTPNALGLAHRQYGCHWRGLEPPRHLHLFTPTALQQCARTGGFEQIEVRTLSAESAGIYRASDEIGGMHGVPGCRSAPASVVRSWRMRYREYRETLRDPQAGQDILLIGVKPT
jgi:SAM-dependent methyltransferase